MLEQADIMRLLVEVGTILVVLVVAIWRLSASWSKSLDALRGEIRDVAAQFSGIGHQLEGLAKASDGLAGGLEAARKARADMWLEVRKLETRQTRSEERLAAMAALPAGPERRTVLEAMRRGGDD